VVVGEDATAWSTSRPTVVSVVLAGHLYTMMSLESRADNDLISFLKYLSTITHALKLSLGRLHPLAMRSSLQLSVSRQVAALRHQGRRSLTDQASRHFICSSCQRRSALISPAQWKPAEPLPLSIRHQSSATNASNTRETIIPQTHYEFFPQTLGAAATPPSGPFSIDSKALRKEFLQLQAKAHPDMVPADKKRQAEGLSARINEAYKTLLNPLLRAQYLLSLRGIDVAEDETAKVEDPELLMEVLETRETIEDAQEEKDLEPLKGQNEGRIADSVQVLEDAFKNDDMDLAKSESVKLRYWINIRESIDAWEKGKPVVLVH